MSIRIVYCQRSCPLGNTRSHLEVNVKQHSLGKDRIWMGVHLGNPGAASICLDKDAAQRREDWVNIGFPGSGKA